MLGLQTQGSWKSSRERKITLSSSLATKLRKLILIVYAKTGKEKKKGCMPYNIFKVCALVHRKSFQSFCWVYFVVEVLN